MENKELFTIKNTKHFSNGRYVLEKEDMGLSGSVYEFSDIVSVQFNQLKAKLFNLIEASTIDEKQREAMKGLVKGFCNLQFKNVITDLEGWLTRMGFDIEENYSIRTSEPLDIPNN